MLEKLLFLLYKNDIKYELDIAGEKQGWKKPLIILDIKALELLISIKNNGKRLSYHYGKYGMTRKGITKKGLLEYLDSEIKKHPRRKVITVDHYLLPKEK